MNIATVGVGKMGEAVLAGLVKAGHTPDDIVAGVRRRERGEELRARYGVGRPRPPRRWWAPTQS